MSFINLKTEIPGPRSRELMAARQTHVPRGPFHVSPIVVESAKGSVLHDVDGNALIDFAAGIGVNNVGHVADEVLNAVTEQAKNLMHASFNVTTYPQYIELAAALNALTPGTFAKKTFLVNSGAEAVENAIKIARAHTGRQGVVCFQHAFHGRTYMAMSLTAKAKPYKVGFGPLASEVYRAPFPYVYRWEDGKDDENLVSDRCFKEFQSLVVNHVAPQNVAAVIIEPVLGEGGFVPVPKPFMKMLRQFCTEHGIVLIADEIQTGFGRTGTIFACEQLDLVPDLMTIAKGLGGGFPIGAVTGKAEIMDAPLEGGIGGTFGGNPVACAAALAVIKMFKTGNVLDKSRNLANILRETLASWKQKFPIIGDVRGLGPMLAMELVKDRTTKEPAADATKKLIKYAYEHGVICMSSGTHGNVIRFLPPLTMDAAVAIEALGVIESGLTEVSRT